MFSVLFIISTLAFVFSHVTSPNFIFPSIYVNSLVVASTVPSPSFPTRSFAVTLILYVVSAFNPVYVYVVFVSFSLTNL